ncbi:MAG TPA: hypothetical protein VMV69_10080 [Pirellulales bacterium]|nr:hypothetical protein [Pirellulales bacterium]
MPTEQCARPLAGSTKSCWGHFANESALPDAAAARRAITFLRNEFPELGAIVLVRDRDDEPERRGGLEQARRHNNTHFVIVVGFAVVERESWVICGYESLNEGESACLEAERKRLGFDPRFRSHELTACKNDQAKRSPKRVLAVLTDGDHNRERRCWRETPLEVLRDRGKHNGLADYLAEVEQRLAPLISGHEMRPVKPC